MVLKEAYKLAKMHKDNFIDTGLYQYYDDLDEVIYIDYILENYQDSNFICK